MRKYFPKILLRIGTSLIVLFMLITFIFVLVRVAPGTPTQKLLNPKISPSVRAQMERDLNLDKPITSQYLEYIGKIVSWDLGTSYNYKQPVARVIAGPLKFTIIFSLIAFLLQITFGGSIAYWAVKTKNKKLSSLADQFGIFFFVLPSFVLALLLLYIFPVKLGILFSSGLVSFNFDEMSPIESFIDLSGHLILPLMVLTAGGVPVFYKYLKEAMQAELSKEYVQYLKSFGVGYATILKRHVLPNAVIPVISIAGISLGTLFNGALITEYIFGLPGMGRLTYHAIFSFDYPLVSAATLISGGLVILSVLAADIVKIFVNKAHLEGSLN